MGQWTRPEVNWTWTWNRIKKAFLEKYLRSDHRSGVRKNVSNLLNSLQATIQSRLCEIRNASKTYRNTHRNTYRKNRQKICRKFSQTFSCYNSCTSWVSDRSALNAKKVFKKVFILYLLNFLFEVCVKKLSIFWSFLVPAKVYFNLFLFDDKKCYKV